MLDVVVDVGGDGGAVVGVVVIIVVDGAIVVDVSVAEISVVEAVNKVPLCGFKLVPLTRICGVSLIEKLKIV